MVLGPGGRSDECYQMNEALWHIGAVEWIWARSRVAFDSYFLSAVSGVGSILAVVTFTFSQVVCVCVCWASLIPTGWLFIMLHICTHRVQKKEQSLLPNTHRPLPFNLTTSSCLRATRTGAKTLLRSPDYIKLFSLAKHLITTGGEQYPKTQMKG